MQWIFIRGLGRECAHWRDFFVHFSHITGYASCRCINLPGTGDLRQIRTPASIPAIAENVAGRLADTPGPIGIMGLSLGGMVAIELSQHFIPEKISHLVLLNTSTKVSPILERAMPSAFFNMVVNLIPQSIEKRERRNIALSCNLRGKDQELLNEWIAITRDRPVLRLNQLRQLWAAGSYRPDERPPSCHGLIISSKRDRFVNSACSTRLAKYWSWEHVIHPVAGHNLTVDAPFWVINKVKNWLDSTTNG